LQKFQQSKISELLEKYTMFHLKSIFEQHLCTNDGSKSDKNTNILIMSK